MTEKRRNLLAFLLLALLTLGVYWPVIHSEFLYYDDPQFVTENPIVQSGLNWKSVQYAFNSTVVANWHPITTLSHILDCEFFGVTPGPPHLVNALIHSLNTGLLFLLLTRLTKRFWPCAFAAALFALHPQRVESVAWLSERKDVLSAFFFLLTLLAYVEGRGRNLLARHSVSTAASDPLSHREMARVRGPMQSPASRLQPVFPVLFPLVLFALALMSKPMVVTLPFILLLLDVWPLGRLRFFEPRSNTKSPPFADPTCLKQIRALVWEKWPFFVLTITFSALTFLIQSGYGATQALKALTFPDRLGNAVVSYLRYLGFFVFPEKLSAIYPHPSSSFMAPFAWPGWEIGVGIGLLAAVTALCLLQLRSRPYVCVGWFWFLGMLIPVIGLVQVGEQAMADRYTYLPLIGPACILSWLGAELWVGKRRFFIAAAAAGALLYCGIRTRQEIGYWHDTISLFQHAIEVTEINPAAHFTLGVGLDRAGETSKALVEYRVAIAIDPQNLDAHYNMAQIFRKQGRWLEAQRHYEAALKINPNHFNSLLNLANTFSGMGKGAEAASRFERILKIDPRCFEAWNNLAWIYATASQASLRNGSRAVEVGEQACALTDYKITTFVGTLAAAYAEAGRFPQAIATAQKAISMAADSGNEPLRKKNEELLNLYQSNRPYHEGE